MSEKSKPSTFVNSNQVKNAKMSVLFLFVVFKFNT